MHSLLHQQTEIFSPSGALLCKIITSCRWNMLRLSYSSVSSVDDRGITDAPEFRAKIWTDRSSPLLPSDTAGCNARAPPLMFVDALPGHGFPQSCVLPFTAVQVGRLSHLGRTYPHFAAGVEDLEALQIRAMRSRAQERKALGGLCTVTALPPSTHQAVFCLPPHLAALALEQPARLGGLHAFTEFRHFKFDAHDHKTRNEGVSECERLFFSFPELLQISPRYLELLPRAAAVQKAAP